MKKILITMLLFLFGITYGANNIKLFQNLTEINEFVTKLKEHPKPNNKNWSKPDYSVFYKKQNKNIIYKTINNLAIFLGLKKIEWSPLSFTNLLKKIVKKQTKLNEHILRFSSTEDSNFIIITEIGGAVHSLTRILNKLYDLKLIDEQLKIKKNNYIIFNGNAIGNSPYLLETLSIILKLIEINPDQLFFIKGKYEIQENWKNFGFVKELLFKIKGNPVGNIPMEKTINSFFHNLPLALYIDIDNKAKEYIRISYFNKNYSKLNENNFSNILNKKQLVKLKSLNIENSNPSSSIINIMATINGFNGINGFNQKTINGLKLLLPDNETTTWGAISGASSYNKNVFNFNSDAFIILDNKTWTIKSYTQNTNKKNEFKIETLDIFNRIKVDNSKIKDIKTENSNLFKIGTTLDLPNDIPTLIGMKLRIKELNENGGIDGKKVVLIGLNDKYNPRKALKNIKRLVKESINTILLPIGSYTLQRYLNLAKSKKIAIFFPDATSPKYRNNSIRNIVHFLASSSTEGEVITNYLLKEYSLKKIALFYTAEPFGMGALNRAEYILKKHNLIENKDWIKVSHRPGSINLDDAVNKIKNFNPEAIILLSSSAVLTERLLNKLKLEFLFNKIILGISSNSGIQFKRFINKKNLNFIHTQFTPDPEKSSLQIVKNFRSVAKSNNIPLSAYTLEGYIIASLFFDIVKKIKGPITNDTILNAIEKIQNYNFNGINLNFNPETRELANALWLNTGKKTVKIK